MFLYGEEVEHLIARIGQRLSDKGATKEGEKFQLKCKNESEADARSGCKNQEKDRQEGREFVRKGPQAFDFRPAGGESMDGQKPV
jgi:hypothetical protein